MNLTDAYKRLAQYVDSLPPSVRPTMEVVLNANCGNCGRAESLIPVRPVTRWCDMLEKRVAANHGCRAWQKREETA